MIKSIIDTWSSDLFDMDDYGPKNNRRYSYIFLEIFDNFSRDGWTIFFKNKYVKSITDVF